MDLNERVRDLARSSGASVVGVASMDRFEGAPEGHHPRQLLPGAKSVVTFGIRLLDRVLEWPELLKGSELIPEDFRLQAAYSLFYMRSGYDIINDELNRISLTLANYLEDAGHRSLFFPSTYGESINRLNRGIIPGMFSQRHAAVRAGLGEFGLNNVVVTPRYGPRIRFNSVITAAELEPSPLVAEKVCLGVSCSQCLEECPSAAMRVLDEAESDSVWLTPVSRTDWSTCQAYRVEKACAGRCLRVCPVGR